MLKLRQYFCRHKWVFNSEKKMGPFGYPMIYEWYSCKKCGVCTFEKPKKHDKSIPKTN